MKCLHRACRFQLATAVVHKQVHDVVVSLHENFFHAMTSLLAEKLSTNGSLPSGWTSQESFAFQVNMRQTLSRCGPQSSHWWQQDMKRCCFVCPLHSSLLPEDCPYSKLCLFVSH